MRRGALLADFVLLFLESGLLFGLAALIARPRSFAWTLLVLLLVDMIWGFLARFAFSKTRQPLAAYGWARVNLCTVIVAVPALFAVQRFAPSARESWLPFAILAVSLVRTVVDYKISWDFYFPPHGGAGSVGGVGNTATAPSHLQAVTARSEQRTIGRRRHKR